MGLLVWRAARARQGRAPMSPHERTLALWPAAFPVLDLERTHLADAG